MAGTRGKQTVRGMLLSLGAILLAAAAIYPFIPHDGTPHSAPRVDYRVELLTARRAAPYPVAAPEGLSRDWRPTSVRYRGDQGNAWHLGFESPDGQYVAVEQSTEKPAVFIGQASQGARRTSVTQRVGDQVWQRYRGAHYDALVHRAEDGKSTTVVTGTASFAQLTAMAQALATS